MTSQPSIPRTVDELSPERRAKCAAFLTMRSDLRYLENSSDEPLDPERVAAIHRRLSAELLKYSESGILSEGLELTELELARARKNRNVAEETRYKLRVYVDDFLRDKLGI